MSEHQLVGKQMSQFNSNDREEGSKDKKTILVVDDAPYVVDFLCVLAASFGCNPIPAFSGSHALELFRKNRPDLITVDLGMPEMTGHQLINEIRKIDSLVPIIVITGFINREDREKSLALGANAFLHKPLIPDDFAEQVATLLNISIKEDRKDPKSLPSDFIFPSENIQLKNQAEAFKDVSETEPADVDTEQHYALIAHDMANELAQIGGALREIRHLAAGSDEIQEECDLIEKYLHRFGQLVRRLKNYAEIARTHVELIDVSELIKRVESLIRPRIPSNILFEIGAYLDTSEAKVLVDTEQVIDALNEITNNAVHALRNSEGAIKLNFNVRDSMLVITISNNGPGIPEDIREKLFKQQVRSSKEKGTGMGLLLAKQVLNTFGGNIVLEESSPAWVTFTIQLPLYEHQKDE